MRPRKRSRLTAYAPGIAASSVTAIVTTATKPLLRRKARKPWPPSSVERRTARYESVVISEKDTQILPGSSTTSAIGRSDSTIMYQNGSTVMRTRKTMVSTRRVPQTFSSRVVARRRRRGAGVPAARRGGTDGGLRRLRAHRAFAFSALAVLRRYSTISPTSTTASTTACAAASPTSLRAVRNSYTRTLITSVPAPPPVSR